MDVPCAYCNNPAEFVGGDVIYPHRPDLADKKFWRCEPCQAYVGCHKGTELPLGRLANAELRKAKMNAHAAFDPLWKEDGMDRSAAYTWLQEAMGLPEDECHIGMFDLDRCQEVVRRCNEKRNVPSS